MSRPLFTVSVRIVMQNGQSGQVVLDADRLVTISEIKDVFARAVAMTETMRNSAAQLEERPGWTPSVVGKGA
jgi:hypothetical protein